MPQRTIRIRTRLFENGNSDSIDSEEQMRIYSKQLIKSRTETDPDSMDRKEVKRRKDLGGCGEKNGITGDRNGFGALPRAPRHRAGIGWL